MHWVGEGTLQRMARKQSKAKKDVEGKDSERDESEILRRLTRIGEGPRRPLEEFLRYAEGVEEDQLRTVKGFLFDLFCKIYGIPKETLDTEEGRLLRFKFFQELGKGATVEEIKDIFIRNLFYTESQALAPPSAITSKVVEEQEEAQPSSLAARAKDYIDNHYSERLSLNVIADHLSVCKEHLSRAFKRAFGVTVTEYIHSVRIDLAKSLILEMQLSLKEICYELGYQSYNDFYRNFRKLTGVSPRDYQESGQGD